MQVAALKVAAVVEVEVEVAAEVAKARWWG